MFTGIIQHVGRVTQARAAAAGKRFEIEVGPLGASLAHGSSVSVDGACLTVAAIDGDLAEFDAVAETLSRTTLNELVPGRAVNLEPALAAGAPLDGHIVQGHVDCVATVARIDRHAGNHILHVELPADMAAQMVHKGSVAVAGVSLTLAEVGDAGFSVALVPTTLQATTLGDLRISDKVNIELDVLGKYVRRYLAGTVGATGITIEKLREEGFR